MIVKDNYVQFEELNKRGIIHFYTTSKNSFNLNIMNKDDAVNKVLTFCKENNFDVPKVVFGYQQHTTNVQIVNEDNINDDFKDTDGLITNLKNVALVNYSADCQSIILYDPVKEVIGSIHSGWKGTLNKIIKEAIIKFKKLGSDVSNIEVYICPSLLCFEVDYDLVEQFKKNYKDIDDCISLGEIKNGVQKYYIDTVKVNVKTLNELGVKKIVNAGMCTKCDSSFHSYRRDKNDKRNMALIMLN